MQISYMYIIDTTVKIGLGAVITALATHKTIKLNISSERNKDFRSHKLKTIEFISENCEAYFNSYNSFKNMLLGYYKINTFENKHSIDERFKDNFRELDKNLRASLNSVNIAQSRLSLINGKEAQYHLKKTIDLICNIRNNLMIGNEVPGNQEFELLVYEITESVNKFHNELSSLYESIM